MRRYVYRRPYDYGHRLKLKRPLFPAVVAAVGNRRRRMILFGTGA